MAVDFSGNWGDEIADVTESSDYQTCEIRVDWSNESKTVYDYETNQTFLVRKDVSEQAAKTVKAFHTLQRVLSDPTSTPEQEQAAQDAYALEETALKTLVNADPTSEVIVSSTEPAGLEGDLWANAISREGVVFVYESGTWTLFPVDTIVYEGQARYIPVRAGVWQGGQSQANATTIRAVRFQVPRASRSIRIHTGAIVTIVSAPFNENLDGRTAKVTDDFQGSTTATRTFHAMMDSDSEDT